jgi:GntR family transcriptional regulator, transcriptional repressor for pyruvate dehydrogenase complex
MNTVDVFQRIKKVRVSDTVVDQVISLIEDGTLKIGDQLPSERDLVNQFQVARASVREALRILEFQGVIEVQPGKGAFIVGNNSHSGAEEGVRQWFRDHASEILEMLEVREVLERRAVFLAANQASPELVVELQETMSLAKECIAEGDLDRLVSLDRRFHRMIVNASGNQLLSQLVDMIIEAMVSPRRSLMRLPGRAEKSWEDHQAILQAILDGQEETAVQAITDHIDKVRRAILAFQSGEASLEIATHTH